MDQREINTPLLDQLALQTVMCNQLVLIADVSDGLLLSVSFT